MNINCCRRADCADHNCPGRNTEPPNPASQEAALKYLSTILAGIGVFSFVMAIVIWSVK
jgi:hypothetical protein